MELKNITKEELETLSYADVAFLILKENKKSMNTMNLYRKVCDLFELSDSEYEAGIGDFYTALTTDKRFILLESAEWDLRDNHSINFAFDDDDDEEEEEMESEEIDEDEEEIEEDIEEAIDDEDIPDDDMDDLNLIDEDEEIEP